MQGLHLPTAERHGRLSNIITTLLRISLLGITGEEDEPRTASFELLSAICTYLDFEGRPAVHSKGELHPLRRHVLAPNSITGVYCTGHPGAFLTQVSEGLASHAPHLTMDFISELAGSIGKLNVPLRAHTLQYLGPSPR